MKRNVAIAAAAALLSLSLTAGAPAFAQAALAPDVAEKVTTLGIDLTAVVLTEEQVAQVEAIVNGTEADDVKAQMIEDIVAAPAQ